ncbi:MAG: hypothetical protein ABIK77_03520 [candidate division WOR-3 bacterium]
MLKLSGQRFLIMELENKEKEIIKGGGLWGYLYLLRMLKLLLKGLIINLLRIIIIILLTGINIALLMGIIIILSLRIRWDLSNL